MLFSSFIFLFLFLPITLLVHSLLVKYKTGQNVILGWLVISSLFFYGWWDFSYLPILTCSLIFNYLLGKRLSAKSENLKKLTLIFGIVSNLLLLGYFKYYDFLLENINTLSRGNLPLVNLVLPLGISFFTFQQITYLVDSYRGDTGDYNFIAYSTFVTFFPQLIAGPIVHHKEMMPQFMQDKNLKLNKDNFKLGCYLFAVGLFKKVVLADSLAPYVNQGFDSSQILTMIEAWVCSISYSLQLYFDFSGYADMAIGCGLLFNIRLPLNFNSPYKALNIQDFWRRWHMTLSRFLRDYIYIPLGGNRLGEIIKYRNLLVTFVLGGTWHGAGWTFIVWGTLHGIALILFALWQKTNLTLPRLVAWLITFNFVNATWVFFRANSIEKALQILESMIGLNGTEIPIQYLDSLSALVGIPLFDYITFSLRPHIVDITALWHCIIGILVVLVIKNCASEYKNQTVIFSRNLMAAAGFGLAIIFTSLSSSQVFLYFNF